ncbi:MAG: glycogen-binding domain-containing protein [Verrucomicrobiae bacterium]|nr:glycogen-binding domain-containing protein [Verrucomicrobiae bacterium]
MFNSLNNLLGRRAPQKGPPLYPETPASMSASVRNTPERRQTYSKIFRWRLPDGQTQEPATVEVVGSFTHWQRVPMLRDGTLDAWHVAVHHIVGNRTHHYMLLVDGQPVYDKTCDGLAVPHGPVEEQYQLMTDRGPRVFMLFAQAR